MVGMQTLRPRQLVQRTIPLTKAGESLRQMGDFATASVTVIDDFG